MKTRKTSLLPVIKTAVCIAAVVNLAALFIFHYGFSSVLAGEPDTAAIAALPKGTENAEEKGYEFSFDSDTLTYDGSSDLDLLDGVSLTDPDGNPVDTEIYARITTKDSISDKIVIYSADTAEGQLTASRELKLENYSGPKFTLPDPLPEVSEASLPSILSTMPDDGSFCAEDGYGNDISSAVTFRYTRSETIPSKVHYVFKVTNMFNDSVSAEADFTISDPRPLITLTENSVTVKQGEVFTPEAYISSAIDIDGTSLLQAVTIQGPLNIDEPGTYTFTYTVTGAGGRSSLPAKLNVTVE